jgi:hypothetical protein
VSPTAGRDTAGYLLSNAHEQHPLGVPFNTKDAPAGGDRRGRRADWIGVDKMSVDELTSKLVSVEGYQTRNVWEAHRSADDYLPCGQVVTHPQGATGPCILTADHEAAHEAVFFDRYRSA